jgi:AraC family transcriptional regulator
MQDTYERRPVEVLAVRQQEARFAACSSPTQPSAEHCALKELRNAVADLLYAVSGAFQEKPEEASRYVSRTIALLRLEASGVAGSLGDYARGPLTPSFPRGGLAPWQIRRVSTYIDSHLHLSIGTRDLARLVQLSVFHFSRAFRVSFDESPHTYVMRRRIERAQGMMLQTDSSLAQIAIECGLADQAHFNKSFRRFVGQSPGAWRRARTAPLR